MNLITLSFLCAFLFAGSGISESGAVIFPAPEGLSASEDYQVTVDKQEVFCYPTWRFDRFDFVTNINNRPVSPLSYAVFDFSSPVSVELTLRAGLIASPDNVRILPSGTDVIPEVEGNIIRFHLKTPGHYTIDPNNDGLNALHLFTSVPETDIPVPDDPDVIYFGPGVHDIDDIVLNNNQTLYLSGGAFLRPSPSPTTKIYKVLDLDYATTSPAIRIYGATNVTIRGRGILSGIRAYDDMRRFNLFRSTESSDVILEGIVLADAPNWAVLCSKSKHVHINNLKVLGWFQNSDGICMSGSSDSLVENCFLHNADDGLEIKAWSAVKNIEFKNSQVWADAGTPMGITAEIEAPVENVRWNGITVIHYTAIPETFPDGRAAMMIHALSGGTVHNILFENIVIESIIGTRPVIRVSNEKLTWNGLPKEVNTPYSSISDITFRNVNAKHLNNPELSARLHFVNDGGTGLIRHIALENINIANNPLMQPDDERIRNIGSEVRVHFEQEK